MDASNSQNGCKWEKKVHEMRDSVGVNCHYYHSLPCNMHHAMLCRAIVCHAYSVLIIILLLTININDIDSIAVCVGRFWSIVTFFNIDECVCISECVKRRFCRRVRVAPISVTCLGAYRRFDPVSLITKGRDTHTGSFD